MSSLPTVAAARAIALKKRLDGTRLDDAIFKVALSPNFRYFGHVRYLAVRVCIISVSILQCVMSPIKVNTCLCSRVGTCVHSAYRYYHFCDASIYQRGELKRRTKQRHAQNG
jgi:hypothetical protein